MIRWVKRVRFRDTLFTRKRAVMKDFPASSSSGVDVFSMDIIRLKFRSNGQWKPSAGTGAIIIIPPSA